MINKYLLKNFKVDFTFLNIVNKKNMKKRLKKEKNLIDMINLIIIFMKKFKKVF